MPRNKNNALEFASMKVGEYTSGVIRPRGKDDDWQNLPMDCSLAVLYGEEYVIHHSFVGKARMCFVQEESKPLGTSRSVYYCWEEQSTYYPGQGEYLGRAN